VGLAKFAQAAIETAKALTQLQAVSSQSFENLSAMATAFATGGTKVEKFASEFANLSQKIAEAGQKKAIREADKEWVQWANDIRAVTQQFDNLANGARVAFDPLTTMETKVQALLESLAKIRDPQEQWLKLADIFRNLSSEMDRAQFGKALGLSPETIATLSLGSAAVRQMAEQVKQLGLALTDLDKLRLEGLRQSQTPAAIASIDAGLYATRGAIWSTRFFHAWCVGSKFSRDAWSDRGRLGANAHRSGVDI